VARFVIDVDAIDDVDTEQVMGEIAEAIAVDARTNAAKGKTLGLSGGISVTEVSDTRAVIESTAKNPRSSPEHAEYPWWVEKGTSDTKAQPYLKPAAMKYRSL
jgi:hypothetical protein